MASVALLGDGLAEASAGAKVVNFASNLAALALFAARGVVLWKVALPMALGQLCGGWLGAHLAVRRGDGLVRRVVVVEADPRAASAPWRVVSLDGAVELTFSPAASHREGRDLLLASLQVTQLAGTLSGRIPGPDGAPLTLDGLPALAEDLTARW